MFEQLKDLKIEESDREDSLLIISELNTVMEYIQNVSRQSSEVLKNEELLEKYLIGLSSALIQVKKNEISWRLYMSEKYGIPLDFIYRNGDILIRRGED